MRVRVVAVSRMLFLTAWLLLAGAGFWWLFVYANTSGPLATAGERWPSESRLARVSGMPTLLVFVHPQCPCSAASIGELERLVPYMKGRIETRVVFFRPRSKSESWVKDALWEKAQAIPSVTTIEDTDGEEQEKFGVRTSGQVLLYDSTGRLVFNGGITPERGHMGDSDGRLAILAFVENGLTEAPIAAVFGCSIKNPERAPAEVR